MKYLGVRLDRRLCFNAPVTETLAKARGVRPKLSHFLSCRSHLAMRTKFTIYLLFLRSVLTYAAPAWWSLYPPPTGVGWKRSSPEPVSYTHLDVYKRQVECRPMPKSIYRAAQKNRVFPH